MKMAKKTKKVVKKKMAKVVKKEKKKENLAMVAKLGLPRLVKDLEVNDQEGRAVNDQEVRVANDQEDQANRVKARNRLKEWIELVQDRQGLRNRRTKNRQKQKPKD